MIDAYIGLGSNLASPEKQIRKATAALDFVPRTSLKKVSSLFQSNPVGPANQPDYINAVAHVITGLDADALLTQLQAIEKQQGRKRGVRWGPRTLDLDLLLYGNETIKEENLVVPHPEIRNRAFVLYPLYEIAPDICIPGMGPIIECYRAVNPDGIQKLGCI